MQHTLVAVFDNRSDAQNAKDELLASGFTSTDVNVSSADPTGQTNSLSGVSESAEGVHEEGIGASIKHFFMSLFGSDNDEHVSRYSDVVSRGHHVLTLVTQSEPEVERAADIIERFGPVDLDERHDLTGAAASLDPAMLAAGASSGSGIQKSASMSQQSDSLGSSSSSSSSYGSQQLSGETGDRMPFANQDLNDPVPKGQTYQEPMDSSAGRTLQSASSLQGTSSLQGSNDASLGGTIQTGSMQRDMGEMLNEQRSSGSSGSGSSGSSMSRSGMRVYSRDASSSLSSDDDFRKDWQTNYSSLGGSYDDYAPAYRYGSQMRSDSRYAGRHWDDIESDLRSDWDTRYGASGSSTWEKMKAAIRRGWDKITPDSDSDSSYYRSHWESNYSSLGGGYDDYEPAYRYGSQMRNDARYTGRNWDDVESDLRSDWDTRYSKDGVSTWEKMKAAVRHGWNRMTH